jgi:hypothetical protein
VTVIDRSDKFVFKPLLYELLNGGAQPWEVAPTFTQLLAPYPIRFLQVPPHYLFHHTLHQFAARISSALVLPTSSCKLATFCTSRCTMYTTIPSRCRRDSDHVHKRVNC